MKLTKRVVDKLPRPEKGQAFYRDSELKGFAVRCTTNTRTYVLETRVKGKSKRITIGKSNVLSANQARREARRLLGLIALGYDPVEDKRRDRRQTNEDDR